MYRRILGTDRVMRLITLGTDRVPCLSILGPGTLWQFSADKPILKEPKPNFLYTRLKFNDWFVEGLAYTN